MTSRFNCELEMEMLQPVGACMILDAEKLANLERYGNSVGLDPETLTIEMLWTLSHGRVDVHSISWNSGQRVVQEFDRVVEAADETV